MELAEVAEGDDSIHSESAARPSRPPADKGENRRHQHGEQASNPPQLGETLLCIPLRGGSAKRKGPTPPGGALIPQALMGGERSGLAAPGRLRGDLGYLREDPGYLRGGPRRLRGGPVPGPPALPPPRRGRGPSGCSPPTPSRLRARPRSPLSGPGPVPTPSRSPPPGPAHRGRGPPGASRGCGQLTAAAPPGCTIRTHRRGGGGYSWRSLLGCPLAAQQVKKEERRERWC